MTLIAPAASPTVAVARALKRTGLEQGKGKDFQVTGRYRDGERKFTYVRVYGNQAAAVIAERADDIERWTSDAGFPFKVSVRYIGRHTLLVDVTNGPGERVREVPPAAEAPAVEEPAEPAAPAPAAAEEPAAEPEPAVSYAEDYRQEQQAKALGWSTRHAEVVRWAAAGSSAWRPRKTSAASPSPAAPAAAWPPPSSAPWPPPPSSPSGSSMRRAATGWSSPRTAAAPWRCGTARAPPRPSSAASRKAA
ncbi:hypothetical protein [Streptomyces scabiei]|uniref:hypothetical protein n=1 Tax=Streptomyces scabiei TaxID=1930 RepID=UPI002FF2AB3E